MHDKLKRTQIITIIVLIIMKPVSYEKSEKCMIKKEL